MIQGLTASVTPPAPVLNEKTSTSVFRSSTPLFAVWAPAGSVNGVVETIAVPPDNTSGVADDVVLA